MILALSFQENIKIRGMSLEHLRLPVIEIECIEAEGVNFLK
jgi:hypothetical protein